MSTGSESQIEEELRLTYVAMTRARDFLYVTWPLRYYHRWFSFTDHHSYAQLCRFFSSEICETMEQISFKREEQEDALSDESLQIDIGAQIRAMWD
jgi:DNA helicase-2/ATP-dependent DNA helicase PcrA